MGVLDVEFLRFGQAGLSLDAAAALLGVSPRTLRRYEAGIPPQWYVLVLRLLAGHLGDLGGETWSGWRLTGGILCTPEHEEITAGDLRSLPYLRALVAALQRERDALLIAPPAPAAPPSNVVPFPTRPHPSGRCA